VEAPEREAALLELSIVLNDAKLRAKRLVENVPEMLAVVDAIQHTDATLEMVWNLHEFTIYADSTLGHDWLDALDN
jgi:hypothetical protein